LIFGTRRNRFKSERRPPLGSQQGVFLKSTADWYVLVVEDDGAIRGALLDVLTGEGIPARAAGNGIEALELTRALGAPALILLDLMMPEMDGPTFLQHQRADRALAGIPVVIMTASRQGELKDLRADALLKKPFTIHQLLSTLEPWIARQAG
jgi:CheY-like chemotaxis protein